MVDYSGGSQPKILSELRASVASMVDILGDDGLWSELALALSFIGFERVMHESQPGKRSLTCDPNQKTPCRGQTCRGQSETGSMYEMWAHPAGLIAVARLRTGTEKREEKEPGSKGTVESCGEEKGCPKLSSLSLFYQIDLGSGLWAEGKLRTIGGSHLLASRGDGTSVYLGNIELMVERRHSLSSWLRAVLAVGELLPFPRWIEDSFHGWPLPFQDAPHAWKKAVFEEEVDGWDAKVQNDGLPTLSSIPPEISEIMEMTSAERTRRRGTCSFGYKISWDWNEYMAESLRHAGELFPSPTDEALALGWTDAIDRAVNGDEFDPPNPWVSTSSGLNVLHALATLSALDEIASPLLAWMAGAPRDELEKLARCLDFKGLSPAGLAIERQLSKPYHYAGSGEEDWRSSPMGRLVEMGLWGPPGSLSAGFVLGARELVPESMAQSVVTALKALHWASENCSNQEWLLPLGGQSNAGVALRMLSEAVATLRAEPCDWIMAQSEREELTSADVASKSVQRKKLAL